MKEQLPSKIVKKEPDKKTNFQKLREVMDEALFLFPPMDILKQLKGCIITNVSREKERTLDVEYKKATDIAKLTIELDGFADLTIEVINGKTVVNVIQNGCNKMLLSDKLQFLLKLEEESK